eukprot:SAG31_NODE_46_length_30980_cov_226.095107_8_plen_84_part_00
MGERGAAACRQHAGAGERRSWAGERGVAAVAPPGECAILAATGGTGGCCARSGGYAPTAGLSTYSYALSAEGDAPGAGGAVLW